MEPILRVKGLARTYRNGDHTITVLENIDFSVNPGLTVAIVGPSGSGKTTLLGLCAGLDRASAGTVELNGMLVNALNEDQRASLRNRHVGFIFQDFQLIPTLTALENVMVPLELRREPHAKSRATELLAKVGLAARTTHYPVQLSGGEQQRVALARAFVTHPQILFADEPTGNLDAEASANIEHLLFELNREAGTTLIVVTHNPELAAKTQRIITLKSGRIISDQYTHAAPTLQQ